VLTRRVDANSTVFRPIPPLSEVQSANIESPVCRPVAGAVVS
jgi:hypothetical protein